MRRHIHLPEDVQNSICKHLRSSIARAVRQYDLAVGNEDTLTGHLGSSLVTLNRSIRAVGNTENRERWTWSIRYVKFASKTEEHASGADGIFELKVVDGRTTERKSMLFQAKKEWSADPRLLTQALRMSTWREAATVFDYTSSAYLVYRLDDVIRARGVHSQAGDGVPLPEFLCAEFLRCLVGDNDLYFDPHRRILRWRDQAGKSVGMSFPIRHAIRIHAEKIDDDPKFEAISPTEIADHRMGVTPEQMLGVSSSADENKVRKAKKRLALAYHPDKMDESLDELSKRIAKRRMQEIADAAVQLRNRTRLKLQ